MSVYALYDRRDMKVRYVGVTNRPLSERLAMHRQKPTNGTMRAWLAEASERVCASLLETVPVAEWESAERGWIAWFRRRGQLYNVDRGGLARDERGALRPFLAGAYVEPALVRPLKPKRRALKGWLAVPDVPERERPSLPGRFASSRRLAEISARQMASLRR